MAKKNPRALIKESEMILEEVFQGELAVIGDKMIAEIMRKAKALTPAQRINAVKELKWPGEAAYLNKVREALAEIALEAINQARKEIPKAKKIQLTETIDAIMLDRAEETDSPGTTLYDQLPSEIQKKIKKQSDLLVGSQLHDLEKEIQFQFLDSVDTTDDMDVLRSDLQYTASEWITGNSIRAGAGKVAASIVNDSRNAFFFVPEVLDEIDAFVFTNGDPVTPICQDLNGTVFAKDDPNMFKYTPPLHWNCKSYIEPILQGKLGDKEIEPLKPSTQKLENTIQFSEVKPHCNACGC